MAQKIVIPGQQTVSLTFGDAGENHVGNQMIGELGAKGDGFTCEELIEMCTAADGEYHDFGNDAGVAVFRGFISQLDQTELLAEMNTLEWDQKFLDTRRNRVLNKHARTNVTFLDGVAQEPDYEQGKGRIVDVNTIPIFAGAREYLVSRLVNAVHASESKAKFDNLVCEGNNYYDNTKCGIGFHGDSERRRVIAIRLGASMPMKWQWFQNSVAQGDAYEFTFNGGDMYIMSEKAVGTDWKLRNPLTLRHSAGCAKYTTIKPPSDHSLYLKDKKAFEKKTADAKKADEKAAKLEMKAAEKAAKLEMKATEKAAKLEMKAAEKAAKLEMKAAEKAAKLAMNEAKKKAADNR